MNLLNRVNTNSYLISSVECRDNEFMCSDGTCTLLEWRCDGRLDCADNSDEMNCPATERPAHETTGACIKNISITTILNNFDYVRLIFHNFTVIS